MIHIHQFHTENTDLKKIEKAFDQYFLKRKIDCIKMTHHGKKYDNFFVASIIDKNIIVTH
jgi:hypothetical protein